MRVVMKFYAFPLVFIALFACQGFPQDPYREKFYQDLFLRDGDIVGLHIDSTYRSGPIPPLNGYIQEFSLATGTARIYLVLFKSNKDALDTINAYRNNVACYFYPGLWREFNGASIGDSCWHGNCLSPTVLVHYKNLMVLVGGFRQSTDSTNRSVAVDLAKKVINNYNAGAVSFTGDTVYELCSTLTFPSGANLFNNTGDTVVLDSILVMRDTIAQPDCGLRFEMMQSMEQVFAYENDTMNMYIGCRPGKQGCSGIRYNQLAAGAAGKIKISPQWMRGFLNFQIDVTVDTGIIYLKSYCSDNLTQMQARLVFFIGEYKDTLVLIGWRNLPQSSAAFNKAIVWPGKIIRSKPVQYYDILGRRVNPALIAGKSKKYDVQGIYIREEQGAGKRVLGAR
jgi:hypothetical protein